MSDPNHTLTRFPIGLTYLQVGDREPIPLVSVVTDWAVNEIPRAQCQLVVGRDAQSWRKSQAHTQFQDWSYWETARVQVGLETSTADSNKLWTGQSFTLFTGRLATYSLRKSFGKLILQVNLVHWLADLASTSMFSADTQPGLGGFYAAAAFMRGVPDSTQAKHYTTRSLFRQALTSFDNDLSTDLWSALKGMFTYFSAQSTGSLFKSSVPGAGADPRANEAALAALRRIEGPIPNTVETFLKQENHPTTAMDYRLASPLQVAPINFNGNASSLAQRLATGIANESVEAQAQNTIWDKMVGQYFPTLGLALVPMIERALVVADVPTFTHPSLVPWETLYASDLESVDPAGTIERPVRGVLIPAPARSRVVGSDATLRVLPGGQYIHPDPEHAYGSLLIAEPPAWLRIGSEPRGPFDTDVFLEDGGLSSLYGAWAREVFAKTALRHKVGTVASRFRLDIGPGSIVKIINSAKDGVSEEDQLDLPFYGCVSRVSCYIHAEVPIASTNYQLTFIRSTKEYLDVGGYSTTQHPLFGQSIHGDGYHGSPIQEPLT